MSRRTKPQSCGQLQRCVMRIGYVTPLGAVVEFGQVLQGIQDRPGGPVEITLHPTLERVCFTARECGLPLPEVQIEDPAADSVPNPPSA